MDDAPGESGFPGGEDDPFGSARDPNEFDHDEFDYSDGEPGAGYARPDDGRERFLGADGIVVDAYGNPVE